MKRLYPMATKVAAIAALAALSGLGTGCALDGSSQTEGTREGVSSSVDNIIAGNDSKEPGQGQGAGKNTTQDPRAVAEQRLAPQPQPWRTGEQAGSEDPSQPQPQPWNPNQDPSDPNNQKR